jgi:DNA mismatch repair ATPase MutS
LDRYLKTLVQDFNRYVAIAEEFPNDPSAKVKAGGLMHDRKVSRVITPGTLIDENFMDPFTNNYVLNIHIEKLSEALAANHVAENEAVNHNLVDEQSALPIGLAWLDLSTGHFFTQSTTLAVLPSLLARIGPREIVLDESFRAIHDHNLFSTLREDHHLVTYVEASEPKPMSEWSHMLESPVPVKQEGEFTTLEIAAGSTLLQYVETRLQGSAMKLQPPSRQLDVMGIDKNTLRALEIKTTIRDDLFTGSLLHTVRRTVTKGGARLLDSWLSMWKPIRYLNCPNTDLCQAPRPLL